jgi:uncharacterized glyoxalase superfamily protein PhnB
MATVQPIPDGYHSLTPHLIVKGGAEAIAFYQTAFGAEELMRMPSPDGRTLLHAEVRIGDSVLMLCDEMPEVGSTSPLTHGGATGIHLYVEDVDAVFAQAVEAGATVKMEPQDMFWGDRFAKVTDPFGYIWGIATHKQDLTPEEVRAAAKVHMSPGSDA